MTTGATSVAAGVAAGGSVVSVETADASVVVSTGAEVGAWQASIELSLTSLVESVPQPPTRTPRAGKTTRTAPTREIERTPSPLLPNSVPSRSPSPLRSFAHGRDT